METFIIIVLVMLFWATVTAYVGGQHGRLWIGFLLGATLGPIGTLLTIFFVRDKRPLCAYCRSPLLSADASVCARCGREVANLTAAQT